MIIADNRLLKRAFAGCTVHLFLNTNFPSKLTNYRFTEPFEDEEYYPVRHRKKMKFTFSKPTFVYGFFIKDDKSVLMAEKFNSPIEIPSGGGIITIEDKLKLTFYD